MQGKWYLIMYNTVIIMTIYYVTPIFSSFLPVIFCLGGDKVQGFLLLKWLKFPKPHTITQIVYLIYVRFGFKTKEALVGDILSLSIIFCRNSLHLRECTVMSCHTHTSSFFRFKEPSLVPRVLLSQINTRPQGVNHREKVLV